MSGTWLRHDVRGSHSRDGCLLNSVIPAQAGTYGRIG